jgi:hypothetical protein
MQGICCIINYLKDNSFAVSFIVLRMDYQNENLALAQDGSSVRTWMKFPVPGSMRAGEKALR